MLRLLVIFCGAGRTLGSRRRLITLWQGWEVGVHEEVATAVHVTHWGVLEGYFLVSELELIRFKLELEVLVYGGKGRTWNRVWGRIKTDCALSGHNYYGLTVWRDLALFNRCWIDIADVPEKVLFSDFPDGPAFDDVDQADPATSIVD